MAMGLLHTSQEEKIIARRYTRRVEGMSRFQGGVMVGVIPACGLRACLPQAGRGEQAGIDLYRIKVG